MACLHPASRCILQVGHYIKLDIFIAQVFLHVQSNCDVWLCSAQRTASNAAGSQVLDLAGRVIDDEPLHMGTRGLKGSAPGPLALALLLDTLHAAVGAC